MEPWTPLLALVIFTVANVLDTTAFGPVSKMVDPISINMNVTIKTNLLRPMPYIEKVTDAPKQSRLPLSRENRWYAKIQFLNLRDDNCAVHARYGPTVKRGALILACPPRSSPEVVLHSDTLILAAEDHDLVIEATNRDGTTLYANATFKLYPYVLGPAMPCSNITTCPNIGSECKGGTCVCQPNHPYLPKENACVETCSGGPCAGYSDCYNGYCDCQEGKKRVGGSCQPSECSSTASCTGTNCACISGECQCGGAFGPPTNMGDCPPAIDCNTAADCAFWDRMECSAYKKCECWKNSTFFDGSCTPNQHLGWCPYGKCYTDNAVCDKGICTCKPEYVLKLGIIRTCAKKERQTSEQECITNDDCGTGGQICEIEENEQTGACRCPRDKQLLGLKCVDIPKRERKLNIKVLVYVTLIFVGLVAELVCFGGCLYVMHVRAQNEVDNMLQRLQVTEDFELAADTG